VLERLVQGAARAGDGDITGVDGDLD
jgi:hypothetical protein